MLVLVLCSSIVLFLVLVLYYSTDPPGAHFSWSWCSILLILVLVLCSSIVLFLVLVLCYSTDPPGAHFSWSWCSILLILVLVLCSSIVLFLVLVLCYSTDPPGAHFSWSWCSFCAHQLCFFWCYFSLKRSWPDRVRRKTGKKIDQCWCSF